MTEDDQFCIIDPTRITVVHRIAMTLDRTIFEPRQSANESLRPSQESLDVFLAQAEKECGRELHLDDLTAYRCLLQDIENFKKQETPDGKQPDVREQLLYGVLGSSCFINAALPHAVEEFKYHLHALHALDFRSPMTLMKSIQLEMGRLDVKRTRDLILMVKFQEMLAGQKKIRIRLMQRYLQLAAELRDIALYVRNNLLKIEKRCEAAVSMLSSFELGRVKERQLIEEIRAYFKKQLKAGLNQGRLTKQELENARNEFIALSTEISSLVREDAAAMRSLYQELAEHVKKSAQSIDGLLQEIESKNNDTVKENRSLFRQVGNVLVSLVSNCKLEAGQVRHPADSAQSHLIGAIRKRMIIHLFDTLSRGRRSSGDRRSGPDRRVSVARDYRGPERRNGKTRRSDAGRRKPSSSAAGPGRASRALVHAS